MYLIWNLSSFLVIYIKSFFVGFFLIKVVKMKLKNIETL